MADRGLACRLEAHWNGRSARSVPGCRGVPGPAFLVVSAAFQDRGERTCQRCAVAVSDAPHPGQVRFRAAQPDTGISQRQDPVQRTDRLPHPQAAKVGTEITSPPTGLRLKCDPEARRHRPRVHPDVDGAFLAPRRPVPPWQRRLQQVAPFCAPLPFLGWQSVTRANARYVGRSVVDFGEAFGGPAAAAVAAATRHSNAWRRRSASGGWFRPCRGADAPAGGGTVGGITGRNKEGNDDRTAAGDRVELQSWGGG